MRPRYAGGRPDEPEEPAGLPQTCSAFGLQLPFSEFRLRQKLAFLAEAAHWWTDRALRACDTDSHQYDMYGLSDDESDFSDFI